MSQTLDDAGAPLSPTGYAYTPFGVVRSGAEPAPFGFTGELHHDDLVYLRARWYDPASGTFLGRDPFAGFERLPYSLHPYQYAYSDPIRYTDPSGEFVECSRYPDHPGCSVDGHDGWYETNPEQGRRDTSLLVDFVPVVGDAKGIVEGVVGYDLITGEPLAWWERGLGFVCLTEVRGIISGGVGLAAGVAATGTRHVTTSVGDVVNIVYDTLDSRLLGELANRGIKHTPADILRMAELPDGRIVFLEVGNSNAGLTHIFERHARDFANRGIDAADVPDLIMTALTKGQQIGTVGREGVYEVYFRGVTQRLRVVVGNNGYIVTAYPQ